MEFHEVAGAVAKEMWPDGGVEGGSDEGFRFNGKGLRVDYIRIGVEECRRDVAGEGEGVSGDALGIGLLGLELTLDGGCDVGRKFPLLEEGCSGIHVGEAEKGFFLLNRDVVPGFAFVPGIWVAVEGEAVSEQALVDNDFADGVEEADGVVGIRISGAVAFGEAGHEASGGDGVFEEFALGRLVRRKGLPHDILGRGDGDNAVDFAEAEEVDGFLDTLSGEGEGVERAVGHSYDLGGEADVHFEERGDVVGIGVRSTEQLLQFGHNTRGRWNANVRMKDFLQIHKRSLSNARKPFRERNGNLDTVGGEWFKKNLQKRKFAKRRGLRCGKKGTG